MNMVSPIGNKIKKLNVVFRICTTAMASELFTKLCNFSVFFHPIRHLQSIAAVVKGKSDVMSEDIAVTNIMNRRFIQSS